MSEAMKKTILQWDGNQRLSRLIRYSTIAVWTIFAGALVWVLVNFSFKILFAFVQLSIIGLFLSFFAIQSLRRKFIRESVLPFHLRTKLLKIYPHLSIGHTDLVIQGLRQFFLAYLQSKKKFVAMPSQVADEAWHEFILDTKNYQAWCHVAFGKYLHHSPAVVLSDERLKNDGLRRAWFWACKADGIDPKTPLRLPLLFALDKKLNIENGFIYEPNCDLKGRKNTHCGSDFGASGGNDGSSGDFGGSDSSGDGGGCGGGCGGGGD
jgi:uncharacterized membrane protein YgcG